MKIFMEEAYKEALKAYKRNEIPVGAVIVRNNKIIARGFNNRQKKYNLLGHAEINCILKAEKKVKDWRLDDCEMYVTLEPCEMCNVFIKESRLKNVFFLVSKQKSVQNSDFSQTNDCFFVEKYQNLLADFFNNLRK